MNVSEIDKIRLEHLKQFPELILRKETRTVAICNRCGGEIGLKSSALFSVTIRYVPMATRPAVAGRALSDGFYHPSCPHCSQIGRYQAYPLTRHCDPIEHKIVKINEYILKEEYYVRVGWFKKKYIPRDSIIEMEILSEYRNEE